MAKITLVGSSHRDLKGQERLEKVLKHYHPSSICVESTLEDAATVWEDHIYSLRFFQSFPLERVYSPEQMERFKLQVISPSYEIWVSRVYQNAHSNTNLHCIDKKIPSAVHHAVTSKIMEWIDNELAAGKSPESLIDHGFVFPDDFIENGSLEKHQQHIDKGYDKIDSQELRSVVGEELFRTITSDRDKNFAKKIRRIHSNNPHRNIMAILGCAHIFGGYSGNTYDLLADLNPQRMKLKEADLF